MYAVSSSTSRFERRDETMDLIVPVAVGAVFVVLLAYYVVILIRGDHE